MYRIILNTLLLGILLFRSGHSQSTVEGDLAVKSVWRGGETSISVIHGDFACINDGLRLIFMDVSEPENLVTLGEMDLPNLPKKLELTGNFLIAADGIELLIIDISDPANAAIIGRYTEYPIDDFAISGNLILAADSRINLFTLEPPVVKIIDINDPSEPVLVGTLDGQPKPPVLNKQKSTGAFPSGQEPRIQAEPATLSLAIKDSLAFVLNGSSLRIFNIAKPETPQEIGYYEALLAEWPDSDRMKISGDRLYVNDYNWDNAFITVIDISDPADPKKIGSYKQDRYANKFVIDDQRLYVSYSYSNSILVLNAANPAEITLELTYTLENNLIYASHIATNGAILMAPISGGCEVVDTRTSPDLKKLRFINTFGGLQTFRISGTTAVIQNHHYGLQFYDYSDPNSPVFLSTVANRNFFKFGIHNDHVFGVSGSSIEAIDFSDPKNPKSASVFRSSNYFGDMTFSGDYMFISEGGQSVRTLNISDPKNMKHVHFISVPNGFIVKPYARDNTLFISSFYDGLKIYDNTDPARPVQLSVFDTGGFLVGFTVVGDRAYLADGIGGMRILDISDLKNPKELGFVVPDGSRSTQKVASTGNYVFMDGFYAGIKMFDVRDGTKPVEKGVFRKPIWLDTIELYSTADLVYIYSHEMGPVGLQPGVETNIRSEQDNIVQQFELVQNYPNPFNPVTTIRYRIPSAGMVELVVYNAAGQQVTTLYSQWQNPGAHSVTWDGSGMASGIYYYRLKFRGETGFTESKKMILLK